MVAQFNESLKLGKTAEALAEQYFIKHKINYKDVRDNPKYWTTDIDYLTDIGTVEVKYNLIDALKGKQGLFCWWELEVGNNLGWWFKSHADYFLFFNATGNGVLIKNDDTLKKAIEKAISSDLHSFNDKHRFDYKKDQRFNGYVTAKSMRYYLEDFRDTNVNLTKLVKRKNAG